ncbi:MAG: NUDIX domain-containing protein [Clostridia bacterium]|nr:NUDIX domain-containing protein [Clostridia bacterium]
MPELWDAYDNHFNRINDITLVRGEPLPEGLYHLVSEIIVKHTDGTYLIMQRDFRKHYYGGKWELTAGGSVLKGENPLTGAIRELKEETGLIADDLKEIAKIAHDAHRTLYVEYLYITDCRKDSIVLQEGETVDYKWVDRNSLFEMNGDELASARAIKLIKELNI